MAIENRTGREFTRPTTEARISEPRAFEAPPTVEPQPPVVRVLNRAPAAAQKLVAGGSTTEAVIGACVVALAIIGLASVYPFYLAPIATIAFGAGMLLAGSAVAASYARILHNAGRDKTELAAFGGGVSVEVFTGIAGIVLGILTLVGIDPLTLLPIAMIVFGGGMMFSSGAATRLNVLGSPHTDEHTAMLAREAIWGATGMQVLVGAGAVVLGILALIGYHPLTLSEVSLLGLGGAMLIAGSAIAGRMAVLMRG